MESWIRDALSKTTADERRHARAAAFRACETVRQEAVSARQATSLWEYSKLQSQRREILDWEDELRTHVQDLKKLQTQFQRQEATHRQMQQEHEKNIAKSEEEDAERKRFRQQFLDQVKAKLDQDNRERKARFSKMSKQNADKITTDQTKNLLRQKILEQERAVVQRNTAEAKMMKVQREKDIAQKRRSLSPGGLGSVMRSRSASPLPSGRPCTASISDEKYQKLLGRGLHRIICCSEVAQRCRSADPSVTPSSPIVKKPTFEIESMKKYLMNWR